MNEAFGWGPIAGHSVPADWFPPGFSPEYIAGAEAPDGFLDLFDCKDVIWGQDVIPRAQVLVLTVRVAVASSVPQAAGANRSELFVLEILAGNDRLVKDFSAAGFPAALANFTIVPGETGPASWTARFGSDGKYDYQSHGLPRDLQGYASKSASIRYHDWNGTAGSEAWADAQETFTSFETTAEAAALAATGGRLAQIAHPDGLIYGTANTVTTANLAMTFSKEP